MHHILLPDICSEGCCSIKILLLYAGASTFFCYLGLWSYYCPKGLISTADDTVLAWATLEHWNVGHSIEVTVLKQLYSIPAHLLKQPTTATMSFVGVDRVLCWFPILLDNNIFVTLQFWNEHGIDNHHGLVMRSLWLDLAQTEPLQDLVTSLELIKLTGLHFFLEGANYEDLKQFMSCTHQVSTPIVQVLV
jgi:hypothetical protein